MVDFLKLRTSNNHTINNLLSHCDFINCKPLNNNYKSFTQKNGFKISLHFRKAKEQGVTIGYGYVDIIISPHYHKNNYLHNGDDFTPNECITSITEILEYLKIEEMERTDLKVVNIEYGLNLIPSTDIEKIVKGLIYYKRSKFIKIYDDIETFKQSDATKYKEVKAYAKGLQFIEYPTYLINKNTFRFEIRSKKSQKINQLGIYNVLDLLNFETYQTLFKEIFKEWDYVLLVNEEPIKKGIKYNDFYFLIDCADAEYWEDLMNTKHRNTFVKTKLRYSKTLTPKNNLHTEIKGRIIDKIEPFFSVQTFHRKTA